MRQLTRIRLIGGAAAVVAVLGIAGTTAFGTGYSAGHRGPGGATGTPTSATSPTKSPSSTATPGKPPTTRPSSDPALAAPDPNCTLIVPADPLSAAGLATPYQLTATSAKAGACHETDPGQSAFVQAVVLDPATGVIGVYSPVVVDKGKQPAVPPVVPTLAPGAVVGLWFGSNGDTLTLAGPGSASCVNGLGASKFGQYAYCHAAEFFTAADAAVAAKLLTIPPLGTAVDGQPCPTVRDFSVVDQDQSDNVTSTYLAGKDGRIAQNTAANLAALGGVRKTKVIANGSDNRLLDDFIDPAVRCTPWTAPDLDDPGAKISALPLNELQAAAFQQGPALVPAIDPMTLVDDRADLAKTNLYRLGVGQPVIAADVNLRKQGTAYCAALKTAGAKRIETDKKYTRQFASPDPAQPNLYAFLKARLAGSLEILKCK